jgi:hypothetical protein
MGVAAADFDNDGFVDVCITGYEENALFQNQGDGTFLQVPLPQQAQRGRWSASCAWGDANGDGNLDLFITNYADVPADKYPLCEHTAAGKTISIVCHPHQLVPLLDMYYTNQGNGEFADASEEAGIRQGEPYHGLGVVAADLEQDGDLDFYIANDADPNQLWENQGQGRFIERGAAAGVATNRHGQREAGMGIAIGDFRGVGELDLFVTNFYYETNTYYRNEGALLFSDVTEELGLGAPSRLRLAFGVSAADFDRDGWLDLFVANGHVHDRLPEIGRDEPFAQPPSMFHNQQGQRFAELSASSGPWFVQPHVARGAAVADFDRDGDPDLAVNCLNSPAALLQNESAAKHGWLRIELIGRESNRGGIGAVVRFDLGDRTQAVPVLAGTSYLSCDEQGILIGLGAAEKVRQATVVWPSGRREQWTDLAANQQYRLMEGSGGELSSQ